MLEPQSKETQQSDSARMHDAIVTSSTSIEGVESKHQEEKPTEVELLEKSSFVHVAERLSDVISPYFVILVSLFFYKNNFFLGTIMLFIGLFLLLKVSFKDVTNLIEWIRSVSADDR